jgi:hypothetical protein
MDLASFLTSYGANANDCTDGFFRLLGGKVDTSIKTNGTSDIGKNTHYLSFTTTGAGSLTLTSKTGSKITRNLYAAKAVDGGGFSVIAMTKDFYNSDGTYTGGDLTCNLVQVGTYYIISSGNISISALSVSYDTNNVTTVEPTPLSPQATDANVFAPMDWYPKAVESGENFGLWSLQGTGSYLKMQGDRTINSDAAHSMALDLAVGDSLIFASPSSGSVTVFAEANVDTGLLGTFTVTDPSGSPLTIDHPTFTSSKDDAKTPSSVIFNVSGGNYTIHSDVEAIVFLARFDAV